MAPGGRGAHDPALNQGEDDASRFRRGGRWESPTGESTTEQVGRGDAGGSSASGSALSAAPSALSPRSAALASLAAHVAALAAAGDAEGARVLHAALGRLLDGEDAGELIELAEHRAKRAGKG
jgi:hypothetical protein